jgi:hypothetical protein
VTAFAWSEVLDTELAEVGPEAGCDDVVAVVPEDADWLPDVDVIAPVPGDPDWAPEVDTVTLLPHAAAVAMTSPNAASVKVRILFSVYGPQSWLSRRRP